MPSPVAEVPAADGASALAHFEDSFRFDTDCWDVHQGLRHVPDFVLIDVRSTEAFAAAHVPGAINLPHAKIIAARMAQYAPGTLFVVYCAGPHCNGAARAALRLARLGRPVKVMVGGMSGWREERFPLAHGASAAATA
jgi:rhodanese-related sulfurtransferase